MMRDWKYQIKHVRDYEKKPIKFVSSFSSFCLFMIIEKNKEWLLTLVWVYYYDIVDREPAYVDVRFHSLPLQVWSNMNKALVKLVALKLIEG